MKALPLFVTIQMMPNLFFYLLKLPIRQVYNSHRTKSTVIGRSHFSDKKLKEV